VTFTSFASGIEPVGVVSSLPTVTGYEGPQVVILTTDGKLYRLVSGQWTSSVPTVDLEGTLGANLFSDTLRPVERVTSLPTTNLTQGRIVLLTTDNKLYRYTGNVWTSAVPATDVTGQITGTQITDNAITTSKIAANQITGAKIVAGQIDTRELAANAVTADKIEAGAVVAGKIATDAVTANTIKAGEIVAGKLATNAVTSDTIEANAVIFGKIATGAVKADQIDVGAITAEKIFAGAVKADAIDVEAVTAEKILNGAIISEKIFAGAVTADKISVNELSAVSANIGTFQSAPTGERVEISDDRIRVFDNSNQVRVIIGNLS
jgi:hypothetical protein